MLTRAQAHQAYKLVKTNADVRALARNDLFFLLVHVLGRADIDRDWLYDRCREVQAAPDGYLDLWAREHYKSTIITVGQTIQDILNDPEITVGIFSHTRPNAKAFLKQIKREFEGNTLLHELFPHVRPPQKGEKRSWSEDDGLIVRRRSNPKEATVEAWGLVDGMPTGKHFKLMIYDDVVVPESVTTPEMIKKTTDAWRVSLNLGADGGQRRMIGTRYHFNDSYKTILAQGSAKPRIYTATADGTMTGEPVLMSRETLAEKRRDMGGYVFGCQMLQNPVADSAMGFKREWFSTCPAEVNWQGMNRYIVVDPASTKKRSGDYTAMWVIGLGQDQHYYVLDGVRDRLNLTQRADALMRLHRQYAPLGVGYESYGAQADIEHIQDRMGREGYHFHISRLGGRVAKEDRIRRLVPLFQAGRVLFRQRIMVVDCEGKARDLTAEFLAEEYESFPVSVHDDMFDCLARILDPETGAVFPAAMVARARAKDTFERDFYAL